MFGMINFANLFYYSAYFCYYSWTPLHFLVLFMGLTVLFQLTFTFIYSIFNKKIFSFNKINGSQTDPKCWFGKKLFFQFILLFSLFLLLFMGLTAFIGTIHGSHYIISTNFYLYLQYFQQNFFNFCKISEL